MFVLSGLKTLLETGTALVLQQRAVISVGVAA
jgi:hypothetical protein